MSKSSMLSKILKLAIVFGLIGGAFVGGYLSNNVVQAYPTRQISKTCKSYINLITTGNSDKAYDQSSDKLKIDQPKEIFSKSFKELKASNVKYLSSRSEILDKNATASCEAVLDGFIATPDGQTTAAFSLGLSKDSGTWKVTNITVQ